MFTLTDVSPYQVSMALRIPRDAARDMLSDTSGSTYERDVFGTHYTLDPVARTLTSEVIGVETEAQPEPVALPAYSFYVGSVDFYDAHTRTAALEAVPAAMRDAAQDECLRLWGVWEGRTEAVTVYELRLSDDSAAQRIAYAMAVATGNESILVTRDATQADCDRAMTSTARYRVTAESVREGNRTITGRPLDRVSVGETVTLWGEEWEISRKGTQAGWAVRNGEERRWSEFDLPIDGLPGYRFEPDARGDEIAFLVWSDASVSAVAL